MKLKSVTIIFIIASIIFLSICLFDVVEGNANMGIEGEASITPSSSSETTSETTSESTSESTSETTSESTSETTSESASETTTDNMKLLDGRVFYSESNANDDYIVASIDDTTGEETLTLTMKHSQGSDTEVYGNPINTQNELGNTKEYSTSASTSKIQLIIQGGEATALRLYKDGLRFFTSNQYEYYDDSYITNNDHTSSNPATETSATETSATETSATESTTSSYDKLLSYFDNSNTSNYSSNNNYILKSKVVPQVQTRNPYLMDDLDNWTVYNNLLPNENGNTDKEVDVKKEEQNLLDKIKALLESKSKSESKSESKPLTKYEEAYRKTHGIPKHESKNDNVRCPPCAPCGRCPDAAFQCKYSHSNGDLPRPVLNSFSTFGM
jgi:hypothetical protein